MGTLMLTPRSLSQRSSICSSNGSWKGWSRRGSSVANAAAAAAAAARRSSTSCPSPPPPASAAALTRLHGGAGGHHLGAGGCGGLVGRDGADRRSHSASSLVSCPERQWQLQRHLILHHRTQQQQQQLQQQQHPQHRLLRRRSTKTSVATSAPEFDTRSVYILSRTRRAIHTLVHQTWSSVRVRPSCECTWWWWYVMGRAISFIHPPSLPTPFNCHKSLSLVCTVSIVSLFIASCTDHIPICSFLSNAVSFGSSFD